MNNVRYNAMKKPYDLGPEVMRAEDIEVGRYYYFRDFSMPYTKMYIETIHPMIGNIHNALQLGLRNESGRYVGITIQPGNPNFLSRAYFVNPKPTQKAIGEIFMNKMPTISSKPGVGPANIVRSYLNVQPKTKTRKTKARKAKARKTRKTRKARKA